MDIFSIILFALLICVLIYYNRQLDNQKIKKDLEEKIETKKAKIAELSEEERRVSNQVALCEGKLQALNSQIEQAHEQVNRLLEEGRILAKDELDREIEALRSHQFQLLQIEAEKDRVRLHKEYEEELCKINLEMEKVRAAIAPVKEELQAYQEKRNAVIEALKREEEVANFKDFHRICISSEAAEDIAFLKSILARLHCKSVIAEVAYKTYIASHLKNMLNRILDGKKVCGIYKITSLKNQKCYIGQGVDVGSRLTQHVRGSLGIQSIADQAIHRAIAEEGVENWTFELLESCEKKNLSERERYYINFYQSNVYGYNKTVGNKG